MAYEIVSSSNAQIEKDYGRYNDPPPNLKEITREEFDARVIHGSYVPEFIEHKQIRPTPEFQKQFKLGDSFVKMTLYIYHDGTGVASTSRYERNDRTNQYEYSARFFKFAKCEHVMRELSQAQCREQGLYHAGRCYHVSKCEKCGYVSAVDSSD